jgi:hypothetical protein
MKLIFIFILCFNLNVDLTAKTSLEINFDPNTVPAIGTSMIQSSMIQSLMSERVTIPGKMEFVYQWNAYNILKLIENDVSI